MDYNITWRKKDKGWQFIISYKDSTGKWKQKSKQGFKTKKDAKPAAEKMLSELKKHLKTVNLADKSFDKITFYEFSQLYLEHTKLYKEYNTIVSIETVLKRFKDLNNKELCKITSLDIQKIVDKMTKQHLNNNTISFYLKRLTSILKYAQDQYNLISIIPTHNVKLGKRQKVVKNALTDSEINALLSSFKGDKYYQIIFLTINTGMRISEILGLTWNDINFNECTISVNKQWKKLKNGTWGFGTVKSKNSNRSIPISHTVAKELLKYKNVINIDNRIFNFKSRDSVVVTLNKKLKRYGFNISIHELRHTYATKLIQNGVDFKTAAAILGHNVEQTLKTYSHVNNDMMKKAHSVIENIF